MNLLEAISIFFLTSVTAESTHAIVNKSLHTCGYFYLGGGTESATMDVAMDATLSEKECSGVEVDVLVDVLVKLVRMVVEENPPEVQGIRPEWEEHVG